MNTNIAPIGTDELWLITHDSNQRIEYSSVSPVLDLLVSITQCCAAHLYWRDPAAYELRLVGASSTTEDSRIPKVSLKFPAAVRVWLETAPQPDVLTAQDPRFSSFPETAFSEISSLLALPLFGKGRLAGILTLSRQDSRAFGPADIAALVRTGDALSATIKEIDRERALLEKRLAERKLVERAKGLLQAQHGWSEEDAYYHIRRTSRQQRTPMAVIARRVIDLLTPQVELLSA